MLMIQSKVNFYSSYMKKMLPNFVDSNWRKWCNFRNKVSKTKDKKILFRYIISNSNSISFNSRVTEMHTIKIANGYLESPFKIKLVQLLLNSLEWSLKVDGVCGSLTTNAIGEFQSKYGLSIDYIFGCKCFNKSYDLIKNVICKYGKYTPNQTKVIQHILGINMDGVFGLNTRALVISFQKSKGLRADGIVGSETWAKLLEKLT